jgi:hypothetical protein
MCKFLQQNLLQQRSVSRLLLVPLSSARLVRQERPSCKSSDL